MSKSGVSKQQSIIKSKVSMRRTYQYLVRDVHNPRNFSKELTAQYCICVFIVSETVRSAYICVLSPPPLWSLGRLWKKGKAEYRDWKPNAPESGRCTSMYVSTLWSVYAVYKMHVISQNSRRKARVTRTALCTGQVIKKKCTVSRPKYICGQRSKMAS